ncbi:MAG: carotenoid biosynthesis protein [Acidobacteria bacterium]|nr:carotenoid biosynthesis protein [Acidobacteriota bacterium]
MLEILRLLFGTVLLRPYVFTFFAAYLFLAITAIGWRRTTLFTVVAFVIAFLCEYSSIHNGFPFGLYYYIETTYSQELWIAGVPFMDSLSFTFLSFVSYQMAILLRSSLIVRRNDIQVVLTKQLANSWVTSILAGILMMYLDIVIDPVALQGDKWFLGKIYYYPNGGSYFGITIANFLGWWFVCTAILRIYIFLEKYISKQEATLYYPFKGLFPAGLYFGILGFNLTMTFLIKEITMGWASTFICFLLALLLTQHISACRRFNPTPSLKEHKKDYPNSSLAKAYPKL